MLRPAEAGAGSGIMMLSRFRITKALFTSFLSHLADPLKML